MRIVHNYNLRHHEEEMAFKTNILAVSILHHEATAVLELFYLQTNKIVWNGDMTISNRMTFSLDNDICNGLVQWTSVVMVSMLASYGSGFLFVCVNWRLT